MDSFFFFAEIVGTIAFALSGTLKAIQKRLDIFGVCTLAICTALGGGVIRDLLLGQTPPKMFYNEGFLLTALGVACFTFFVIRIFQSQLNFGRWGDRFFNVCDALGLGIFAVIGTQAGADAGYSDKVFLCLFMGLMTGVGGGVLRDIMCAEIPAVLRKHVYAVAALLGSGTYYLLVSCAFPVPFATLCAVAATVSLRMLARHYQWNLPKALK